MSRSPLACGDRSGFLFAHACDRPASGACAVCGRPICIEHTRMGSSGPTCISCLRGDTSTDRSDSTTGSGTASSSGGGRESAGTDIGTEGQYGGAGASADWTARGAARSEPAKADDPYFYGGGPDRSTYYDADDYAAFDAITAAAAQDAAGESGDAGGAPDTDTGAS